MNHSNMYAVGLALCTFANISSEEMSRDLCNEIEKLLGSGNTYIRKKVLPPLSTRHIAVIFNQIYVPLCTRPPSAPFALSGGFLISSTTSSPNLKVFSPTGITACCFPESRSYRRCVNATNRVWRNTVR